MMWLSARLNIDATLMQQLKDLARDYEIDVGETRFLGTVCSLFPDRKFGYIRCESDGHEYYFSYNQLSPMVAWRDVHVDSRFSFCLGRNRKGTCAVSLAPVSEMEPG
jgi:hypothetical protein